MNHSFNILCFLLWIGGVSAQPGNTSALDRDLSINTTAPAGVAQYSVRHGEALTKDLPPRSVRTAARQVRLTGMLLARNDRMDDVELSIGVENGDLLSAQIQGNGRFDIILSAGSKARITFQKTGHLAKEVLVDASHVNDRFIGRGEDRKVKFDVILLPEDAYPGLVHDGPVGSITFRMGSTALKVDHHEELIATDRVCKLK